MWAGNFIVLLYVGWLAIDGLMGSHVIAIRVEAFSFLPGFAMGVAAGALAGQYLGAGNIAKAKKAVLTCAAIAAGGMGLFGVAFLTLNEEIVALFSDQPTHLDVVPPIIFLAGFIQIPFGVMLVLRNALRGAGDTRAAMIITWSSTFLIRLPLAWFFSGVDVPLPGGGTIPNPGPDWGLWGLWVGLVTELTIRSLLFLGRFLQGGWQRVKV
jgi:Na+-driven multidrug efflux pump